MIIDLFNKLRKINNADWSKEDSSRLERELDFNLKLFDKELSLFNDSETLKYIILQNEFDYSMPISTIFKVYQRLIMIEQNEKNNLQSFAEYLLIYGPDWEEEAKEIISLIETNNLKEAFKVSMKLDYDKYQY